MSWIISHAISAVKSETPQTRGTLALEVPFVNRADCCVENTNHPSSEGTFIVPTPSPTDPRQWIEAKPNTVQLRK
jgi:hypothetical protein